jgi:hypothetical protein
MNDLPITKTRTIRESGKNEFWLRDRIYDDPTILGLGNLQAVIKEKTQPQGGRLDLLLKNPDDTSMYEVEIQLGATDESHIIRTIEYWESEKRRWPRRSHTAVLVAETITNRFFNVVSLLSQAIPIIGIQANIVQVGDIEALHFTKIIDSYEEPEEPASKPFDESHWEKEFPGGLKCARWYRELLQRLYGDIPIKYFEQYLSLTIADTARVWVSGRKKIDRAFIELKPDEGRFEEVVEYLNAKNLAYTTRGNEIVAFNTSVTDLHVNATAHEWLAAQIAPSAVKTA